MSDDCNKSAEVNGAEPFAEARGSAADERPRPSIEELERMLASNEPLRIAIQPDGSIRALPIVLSDAQEATVKLWAADDRLWTTQETVEFNLRTFARAILANKPPNDRTQRPGASDTSIATESAPPGSLE